MNTTNLKQLLGLLEAIAANPMIFLGTTDLVQIDFALQTIWLTSTTLQVPMDRKLYAQIVQEAGWNYNGGEVLAALRKTTLNNQEISHELLRLHILLVQQMINSLEQD
ncbi:hypothetical protein [Herpetosiphon gulosus]|uniref:Uncharacterized protein n=1 Tax=Herpetosiphon gulosus TaxID=1973496 RepID=A0ABP9X7D0_9CHLR